MTRRFQFPQTQSVNPIPCRENPRATKTPILTCREPFALRGGQRVPRGTLLGIRNHAHTRTAGWADHSTPLTPLGADHQREATTERRAGSWTLPQPPGYGSHQRRTHHTSDRRRRGKRAQQPTAPEQMHPVRPNEGLLFPEGLGRQPRTPQASCPWHRTPQAGNLTWGREKSVLPAQGLRTQGARCQPMWWSGQDLRSSEH